MGRPIEGDVAVVMLTGNAWLVARAAAVEAGDVVLVRSGPRDLPRIVELSEATYRKMTRNLW